METIVSIISGMIVLILIITLGFTTDIFAIRDDNATNTNQTASSNPFGSSTNDYTRNITPSSISIGSGPSFAESGGIITSSIAHNSRVISVNAHTSIPAGGQNGVTAKCPPGYLATGGGFAGSGAPGVFVYQSLPDGVPPTGWFVGAFNTTPGNQGMTAIAMCERDDSHRREN